MISINGKFGTLQVAVVRLALLIMAVVIAPDSIRATTLIAQNLAQLSETAESAFVVLINDVTATTSETGSCDLVTGTVVNPVFGEVQTSQVISWKQLRLGRTTALPGMPRYQVGREYLIFLSGKGGKTGYQSPMGLGQGAFSIKRNPATGAALAQNAFNNRSLSAGLDIGAAASAMVATDTKARGLGPAAREAEAEKIKMRLQRGPQNSLDAIMGAAKFFHAQKRNGRTPSQDYRTSAPVQILR